MRTLLEELEVLSEDLDRQMAVMAERHSTQHRLAHTRPFPSIYEMTDDHGKPVMADLMVAKAQVLCTIATLRGSEAFSRPASNQLLEVRRNNMAAICDTYGLDQKEVDLRYLQARRSYNTLYYHPDHNYFEERER